MNQSKAVIKYLERYAETEIACAKNWPREAGPYAHVLTVPAYGEGQSLYDMFASVPSSDRGGVLVILVVNQRESAPVWAERANRAVLEQLRSGAESIQPLAANVQLLRGGRGDLLLVDRTHPGYTLPPKQGVGLARKIGADIALRLQLDDRIDSPWIHCTDADARLPGDYFARALKSLDIGSVGDQRRSNAAALVYDFTHDISREADAGRAILRYEIYLRYYVLGLRSAGSPYDFHTIGSTIAIDGLAYARVRGFPRRQAGEDFHVLAKLAKVGRIDRLTGDPIVLSARRSDRVPFGTGAAINKERERQEHGKPFPAYDPRVFRWLGVWLRAMHDLADPGHAGGNLRDHVRRRAREEPDLDEAVLWSILGRIDAIDPAINSVQRHGDLTRSLNESFDALKTLRFIHALRDQRFPEIPIEQAILEAPFLELAHRENDIPSKLESIRRTLARREGFSTGC